MAVACPVLGRQYSIGAHYKPKMCTAEPKVCLSITRHTLDQQLTTSQRLPRARSRPFCTASNKGHSEPAEHHPLDVRHYSVVDEAQLS